MKLKTSRKRPLVLVSVSHRRRDVPDSYKTSPHPGWNTLVLTTHFSVTFQALFSDPT
jgi:hypothetical protein